ncbi:hypothetical protein BOTCAL_0046g00160 [Botryotinia calthae]|uniref:Uncharacterized protein n=1 Tax=Botryotinia calthae TaxID=38488 RepID=A0A4Y8DBV2_9HELO|nr:hypothetical protein BOTCAL_0046g00160 [Botryotinia calthae]
MSIEDADTEDDVLKVEAIIARYAREIAMVLRGIKKSRSYRFHEPRSYRLEEHPNTDKKDSKALVQKNCVIVQRALLNSNTTYRIDFPAHNNTIIQV